MYTFNNICTDKMLSKIYKCGPRRKNVKKTWIYWKQWFFYCQLSEACYTKTVRLLLIMSSRKGLANLISFNFHPNVLCLQCTVFDLLSENWKKGPSKPPPSPNRNGIWRDLILGTLFRGPSPIHSWKKLDQMI